MLVDAAKVPDLHRLLSSENQDAILRISNARISLTAALFLALSHRTHIVNGQPKSGSAIRQLDLPGVSASIDCLLKVGPQINKTPCGAPSFDVYRLCSPADLLSEEWIFFYDRFRRSAANGRRSRMFRAAGGVLGEMGDNVSHAFESNEKSWNALAGFYVCDDVASFCVADSGNGFLHSLQKNPKWASLSNERDALDAVVNKEATSRHTERSGGGFKQLFNSLLDFNGLVIIRSGSCTFRLENSGDNRRLTVREASFAPGVSVTVVISLRGSPEEIPVESS